MPADDYAVAGGGALKLKGGKVQKSKKKRKDKSAANLERSLSIIDDDGGDSASPSASTSKGVIENKNKKGKKGKRHDKDNNDDADGKKFDGDNDGDDVPAPEYKTEAERRHEEIQRRKVRRILAAEHAIFAGWWLSL